MADTSSPSSSDSAAPPSKVGGKEFLPSDTVTNRFKNFYRMAVGSMSLEGQKKYWEDADERYSASDCKRCENYRDYLMNYSPIIRYMTENIQRLGGDVNSTNVRCRTCKTGMLGGFDHRYGIMICANWMDSRKMQEDVMAHEMVHAYDHLRFNTNLDHQTDLKQVACSEVSSVPTVVEADEAKLTRCDNRSERVI
jgi:mitochondrial inner membrane protease ATP23